MQDINAGDPSDAAREIIDRVIQGKPRFTGVQGLNEDFWGRRSELLGCVVGIILGDKITPQMALGI